MNDLEICKRLAEIKGLSVKQAAHYKKIVNGAGICAGFHPYNPLAKTETGKALCFDLMVEYMRFFKVQSDEDLTVIYVHDLEATSPQDLLCIVKNTDPQKAICLAIIEADEAKKNMAER